MFNNVDNSLNVEKEEDVDDMVWLELRTSSEKEVTSTVVAEEVIPFVITLEDDEVCPEWTMMAGVEYWDTDSRMLWWGSREREDGEVSSKTKEETFVVAMVVGVVFSEVVSEATIHADVTV